MRMVLAIALLLFSTAALGGQSPCAYSVKHEYFSEEQIQKTITEGFAPIDGRVFEAEVNGKSKKFLFKVRTPAPDNFRPPYMALNIYFASSSPDEMIKDWIAMNDAILAVELPTYDRMEIRRRLALNRRYEESTDFQRREFSLASIGDQKFKDIRIMNGELQSPARSYSSLPPELFSTSDYDLFPKQDVHEWREERAALGVRKGEFLTLAIAHLGRREAEKSERFFRALVWHLGLKP